MWVIITGWFFSNFFKIIDWGTAALSVSTVLLGARQSGRIAERYEQLKKIVEIKDDQLRAAMDAPCTRTDLVKRLRDGNFLFQLRCPPVKKDSKEFQDKLGIKRLTRFDEALVFNYQ